MTDKEIADARYKEVRQRYEASAGRLRDICHGMRLNSKVLPFGRPRGMTAPDRIEPEVAGAAARPAMRLPPGDTGEFDGSLFTGLPLGTSLRQFTETIPA